jgi:hypothetical protein
MSNQKAKANCGRLRGERKTRLLLRGSAVWADARPEQVKVHSELLLLLLGFSDRKVITSRDTKSDRKTYDRYHREQTPGLIVCQFGDVVAVAFSDK